MIISDNGLRLIAEFEGFSSVLYNDPVGHCTVGFGFLVHLGPCDGRASEDPYKHGITLAAGVRLLNDKVGVYADAVNGYTTVPLNQNQFDAMTSFCYNIGGGGYRDSTVLREINLRRYNNVCTELRKYVHGTDGVQYPGLVRRREAECVLFNTPLEEIPVSDVYLNRNIVGRIFTRAASKALAGQQLTSAEKDKIKWLVSQ